MGARAYLALAAAAALLPLLVAAGYVLGLVLQSERGAATASLLETARAMAQAIDRELASAEALLRLLASSPDLTADPASFARQAAAARPVDTVAIVLYDAQGRPLMHTDAPAGTGLDQYAQPRDVAAALESEQPRIRTLTRAPDNALAVSLEVPISAGGERYVIAQVQPASYFFERLAAQHKLPRDWTMAVFDQDLVAVAPGGGGRESGGKPAPESIRQAAARNPDSGVSSPDGADIVEAFARAPRSGWLVSVGAPAQALYSDVDAIVGRAALGALFAVMVAAVVAFLLGHRLNRSIGDAVAAASLLGRGQALPPVRPSVREVSPGKNTEGFDDQHRSKPSRSRVPKASRNRCSAARTPPSAVACSVAVEDIFPLHPVVQRGPWTVYASSRTILSTPVRTGSQTGTSRSASVRAIQSSARASVMDEVFTQTPPMRGLALTSRAAARLNSMHSSSDRTR